jgi:ankyrin repeat protein
MWEMARSIAKGNNFGDIGSIANNQPELEKNTNCSDPYVLLSFLELHRKTGRVEFLEMASKIGDNMLAYRFHKGFFVPSKKALYTKFDYVEPLAVLHLDAVVNARSGLTTQIWPSRTDFSCQYAGSMQSDNRVIYSQTRRTELLTLLRVAAWAGRVDEVETIISKGVDVNAHCKLDSLIFQRIWGAQVGLDKWLEASLTNTTTPLHAAARRGHQEVAALLIVSGADVNAKDQDGWTPLSQAARKGNRDIVELLIAKGADVNVTDNNGRAPLWWARRHKEIVELLRKHGAKE